MEMRNVWSHIHMSWIKIGRDNSRVRDPSLIPDHPLRVQCQEDKST